MTPRTEVVIRSVNKTPDNFFKTEEKPVAILQVNNSEIVINFFHISQYFTWYSAIVYEFNRIYQVYSTYELTK